MLINMKIVSSLSNTSVIMVNISLTSAAAHLKLPLPVQMSDLYSKGWQLWM